MGKKDNFVVGDFVFAKVKGYRPWPAKIISAVSKKFSVYFYGTGEIGKNLSPTSIWTFKPNQERFSKVGSLKEEFDMAIKEIESAMNGNDLCPENEKLLGNSSVSIQSSNESIESHLEDESLDKSEIPEEVVEPAAASNKKKADLKSVKKEETNDKKEKQGKTIKIKTARAEPRKSEKFAETENQTNPINHSAKVDPEKSKKSPVKSLKTSKTKSPDPADVEKPEETENNMMTRNGRKIKKRSFYGVVSEVPAKKSLVENLENTKTSENLDESGENELDTSNLSELDQRKRELLIVECKMIDIDIKIRECVNLQKGDTKQCLELLQRLQKIIPEVTQMMLKKNSNCLETMKRLARYVGNPADWKMSGQELLDFQEETIEIRRISKSIYEAFTEKFPVVPGQNFWGYFTNICQDFEMRIMTLDDKVKDDLCFEDEIPETR